MYNSNSPIPYKQLKKNLQKIRRHLIENAENDAYDLFTVTEKGATVSTENIFFSTYESAAKERDEVMGLMYEPIIQKGSVYIETPYTIKDFLSMFDEMDYDDGQETYRLYKDFIDLEIELGEHDTIYFVNDTIDFIKIMFYWQIRHFEPFEKKLGHINRRYETANFSFKNFDVHHSKKNDDFIDYSKSKW
jgi:hypothetical protein